MRQRAAQMGITNYNNNINNNNERPHAVTQRYKRRLKTTGTLARPYNPARHRPQGPTNDHSRPRLLLPRKAHDAIEDEFEAKILRRKFFDHLAMIIDVSVPLVARRVFLLLLFHPVLRKSARPVSCPHGDAGNVTL